MEIGKITIFEDRVIGRGSQDTVVYHGQFERTRDVAVKRVSKKLMNFVDREVELLKYVDDDVNVVRYYCKQEDADYMYIALELCVGTLQQFIASPTQYQISKKEVLRQITSGLSRRIVHRDLRPPNILFARFNDNFMVKISDFGFSKKLDAPGSSEMSLALQSSQTYLAPEVIQNQTYNEASDVYSLGCVFYQVITGAFHFEKFKTDMYVWCIEF